LQTPEKTSVKEQQQQQQQQLRLQIDSLNAENVKLAGRQADAAHKISQLSEQLIEQRRAAEHETSKLQLVLAHRNTGLKKAKEKLDSKEKERSQLENRLQRHGGFFFLFCDEWSPRFNSSFVGTERLLTLPG
jgi:predicted RNase H-like nuclease (RuvC/YqgF family)